MPKLNLDRQQLAAFLPNAEAIRAFEKVLEFVGTTAPDQMDEFLLLMNSVKRVNAGEITRRLARLEEVPQPSRTNLSSILARLEALEVAERRRANLSPILARLENIEKFIGV